MSAILYNGVFTRIIPLKVTKYRISLEKVTKL